MDRVKYESGPCATARALTRVGDGWSMMILRDAGLGSTRFDEFQRSLGIAPNILTSRLARLVADGLLEKRRYSDRPVRHEYVLTESGRDFLPILQALGAWGARHFGGGAMTRPFEKDTGRQIEPVIVDRETGLPLSALRFAMLLPEEGEAGHQASR